MKTYPLIRSKWSNEHIMAGLFGTVLLYLVPQWLRRPADILEYSAVLAAALLIDTAANFIRYKRPVCSVSSAVTSAILYVLTPGVPLWGRLLGVTAALVVGKHIWGGMGKNPINPAVTGVLILSLMFTIKYPVFDSGLILIPAIVISLLFIRFRPFAASGFITGTLLALSINGQLSLTAFLSMGAVFWGCIIITDPVTITQKPVAGAIMGVFTGLTALLLPGFSAAFPAGVLLFNIASYATDRLIKNQPEKKQLHIAKPIPFSMDTVEFVDLSLKDGTAIKNQPEATYSKEEILRRIEVNNVFGFGGAAFPSIKKIKAVLEADVPKKHLIINGVECDPGLIHDKWLLRCKSNEITAGIQLLSGCIDFASITLAVKDNKGIEYPGSIKILKVQDYYPAGAEKILINEVLGITISYKNIPSREGILVLNIQTMLAIYEAVYFNQKADSRYLTVANLKTGEGKIARASLGTNIYIAADKIYPGNTIIFKGGGIMQACVANEEDVVDNSINSIVITDFPYYKESPQCSKCGQCHKYCPAGLEVDRISKLVDEGNLDEAVKLHPDECIKCGSCSYVCRAGRNLSSRVAKAKEGIIAENLYFKEII